MNEAQTLINDFLEELKQTLFKDCNYIADRTMLENTISDVIKLVRDMLNRLLVETENYSQKEINKNKVLQQFENKLVNEIQQIIKDKIFLQSRIDAKKDVPNTLDIKTMVKNFSAKYFI